VPLARIRELELWIDGGSRPDRTFLFDVAPGISRERLDRAQNAGRDLDRFELEAEGFFVRVRRTYLDRAAAEPGRFRVIDSSRSLEDVRAELDAELEALEANGR
jgi:dTMP kinase